MLFEVLVGAAVSLVLLVAVVGFAVRRAPQLFVADRLAEKVYSEGDVEDALGAVDGAAVRGEYGDSD